jgi:outer membrane receptor for ferrienterochelin and colicin
MSLMSDQGLKMVRVAMVFSFLNMVAMPVWAEEKQDVFSENEQTARIQELQRERTKIESELRQLRSQPEGAAWSTIPRSEFSDHSTRSMKEFLESVPGVNGRQGSNGRDVQLSIRGSK